MQASHVLQTGTVVFDDERIVADAGVGLVSLLMQRLELVSAADAALTTGYRPGRKLASVVAGMALGADCIDDLRVLRCGDTERMLHFKAMSPESIGQWLRSHSWGHVAQLDRVLEHSIKQAWSCGAGPGAERMVVDINSSVCEVYGPDKQGAEQAYNHVYGYHPQLATRSETGEMLAARMRGGAASCARDGAGFVRGVIHRVRRCGATGEIVIRADTAFYVTDIVKTCRKLGVRFSIGARDTKLVRESIEGIQERAWSAIKYPHGVAQVGEIHLTAPWSCRLIVRRFKNRQIGAQGQLFEQWGYSAFITDQEGDALELDAEHRRRARQELAIGDLKDGPLAHMPSGKFNANAAWLTLACIAHNLLRWIHRLGLRDQRLLVARTMRFRLLHVPARITRSARRTTIHMPAHWPWQREFLTAVRRIRGLNPKPA